MKVATITIVLAGILLLAFLSINHWVHPSSTGTTGTATASPQTAQPAIRATSTVPLVTASNVPPQATATTLLTRTATAPPASHQTQPAQQNAWQLYKNSQFQYSFNYPASGTILETGSGLDEHNNPTLQQTTVNFSEGSQAVALTVTVYANPNSLTPAQWAVQDWSEEWISSQSSVQIAGIAAYQIRVNDTDQPTDYIYISRAGRMFVLSYWDPAFMTEYFTPEVQANYSSVLSGIIKTFEFN
jgi:hypothetical protein